MNTAPRGEDAIRLSVAERRKPRGQVGHVDNAKLLDAIYEQWSVDPASVDESWQAFFEGFELGSQLPPELPGILASNGATPEVTPVATEPEPTLPVADSMRQGRLSHLLFAYRICFRYVSTYFFLATMGNWLGLTRELTCRCHCRRCRVVGPGL